MKLIKVIKDIIRKVKDYDRLESDYCAILDYTTGNILSKSDYPIESVYIVINSYLEQRDKYVKKEYLEELEKNVIVGTIHGNSWLDNRVIKADVPEEMKDMVGYYGDKVKLIIIKQD